MHAMEPVNPVMDGELLNVLIRLMTPFRRQFRQSLDVNRFLADSAYAESVVEQLVNTEDPRILGAVHFLRERMQVGLPLHSIPVSAADSTLASAAPDPLAVSAGRETSEFDPPRPSVQGADGIKYVKRLR